jgi:glutamate-ammonia-ligase adenylyltransferase
MGRLGGEELNYSSDLDVVFVFDGPEEHSATDWAISMGEGLIHRLAATTEDGLVFRVDPGLRPEGQNGPLARSLAAFRAYYERWAQPWEFQALIRARPIAGDPTLGQQFADLVRPAVYRERLSDDAIREIRTLKARIERERLGPREDAKTQLKIGAGGLVDVEFTTQFIQLSFGAANPRLRAHGTIPAIVAATESKLLDFEKGRWLIQAFRFLNKVRNTLYLVRGRASDALPTSADDLELLARALGYPSPGARVQFMEEYRRVTRRARHVCEDIFYGGRLGTRPRNVRSIAAR